MKISHITMHLSSRSGGVVEVIRSLAKAQNLLPNVNAEIYGLRDPLEPKSEYAIGECVYPYLSIGPRAFGLSYGLYKGVMNSGSDILHSHGVWMFNSIVSALGNRKGIGNVVSIHGMLDPWIVSRGVAKKMLCRVLYENSHWNNASCLHALNESERNAIRDYGINTPIAVIPNGVDLPDADDYDCDWDLGENSGKKVLLFLGRLHEKKGLMELLAAWRYIEKSTDEWCLVIAGWGADKYVKDLIAYACDIKSAVFVGALFGSKKKQAYRMCDAFILPSFSEGLPMTVLEAWAYKKPVIMTRQCNIADGFECGAAREIDVMEKPESLAFQIRSTLNDAAFVSEAGFHGRNLVEKKYTWTAVGSMFMQLYNGINAGSLPDFVDCK